MVFNENGMILNEDYILLEYINHNYLDEILNESEFTDKVKQGAKEIIDKLVLAAEGILKWVKEFPSRELIKNNEKYLKSTLSDIILKGEVAKKTGWSYFFVKIENEIAPYVLSKGYKKWFNNFIAAADYIKNTDEENNSDILNNVVNILYDNKPSENENEWFYANKTKGFTLSLTPKEIIDSAIDISTYTYILNKSYKKIKDTFKYNPYKYNVNLLRIVYSYYINAIKAFRKYSSACVKVCINIIKTENAGMDATKYKSGWVSNGKYIKIRNNKFVNTGIFGPGWEDVKYDSDDDMEEF